MERDARISMKALQARMQQERSEAIVKEKRDKAKLVPLIATGMVEQKPKPPSAVIPPMGAATARLHRQKMPEVDVSSSSRKTTKEPSSARKVSEANGRSSLHATASFRQRAAAIHDPKPLPVPVDGELLNHVKDIAAKPAPDTMIPQQYTVKRRELSMKSDEIGAFSFESGFLEVHDFPSLQSQIIDPSQVESAVKSHSVRDGTAVSSLFRKEVLFISRVLDSMRKADTSPPSCSGAAMARELSYLAIGMNECARMSYGFCTHFGALLSYFNVRVAAIAEGLEKSCDEYHTAASMFNRRIAAEKAASAEAEQTVKEAKVRIEHLQKLLADAKSEAKKLRLDLNEGDKLAHAKQIPKAMGVESAKDSDRRNRRISEATLKIQAKIADRMQDFTPDGYIYNSDRVETRRQQLRRERKAKHPVETADVAVDCTDLYFTTPASSGGTRHRAPDDADTPLGPSRSPNPLDLGEGSKPSSTHSLLKVKSAAAASGSSFRLAPVSTMLPMPSFGNSAKRMADIVSEAMASAAENNRSIHSHKSVIGNRLRELAGKVRRPNSQERPSTRERLSVPLGEKLEAAGVITTVSYTDFGEPETIQTSHLNQSYATSVSTTGSPRLERGEGSFSGTSPKTKLPNKKKRKDQRSAAEPLPRLDIAAQTEDVVVVPVDEYHDLVHARDLLAANEEGGEGIDISEPEPMVAVAVGSVSSPAGSRRGSENAAAEVARQDSFKLPEARRSKRKESGGEASPKLLADMSSVVEVVEDGEEDDAPVQIAENPSADVDIAELSMASDASPGTVIVDPLRDRFDVGVNTVATIMDANSMDQAWAAAIKDTRRTSQEEPTSAKKRGSSTTVTTDRRRSSAALKKTQSGAQQRFKRVPLPTDFESALRAYRTIGSDASRVRAQMWLEGSLLELLRQLDLHRVDAETVGAVTVAFFRAKYGLDRMAFGYLMDLLATCRECAGTSMRALVFVHFSALAGFCGLPNDREELFSKEAFSMYIVALQIILRLCNFRMARELENGRLILRESDVDHLFRSLFPDALFECASLKPPADSQNGSPIRTTSSPLRAPMCKSRDEFYVRVTTRELPTVWEEANFIAHRRNKDLGPTPSHQLEPLQVDNLLLRLLASYAVDISPLVEHATAVTHLEKCAFAPWCVSS